jgi:mono/diheme cytochrome c family protein
VRRAILIAFLAGVLLLLVAACGSEGVTSPAPVTVVGSLPQAAPEPATPAFKLKGDPTVGAGIFAKAGCAGCHTLAAAHATGTVGPDLDTVSPKPDFRLATARVTLGKGVMPKFEGQLTDQQIADVAAYVVKSTGGTP